jgi:hypothetical protein
MAMPKASTKVVWLRKLFSKLDFDQPKLIKLYFNYQRAITSAINPKFHVESKYILTYNIIS